MKDIRTIAMYLPQFHCIPENDAWWGKGFTEWSTVKAAKPLYESHGQPRIPLNQNYYNLLEKETMLWQAELMHQYGIDGLCFYHYYFKNGKKILEKPVENLLCWKDVNIPFCFCWDSASWARTWSNVGGNSWADTFEKKEKRQGPGLLLEQRYGRREDWERHFEYLLSFFKDERYIKVNGAPVFIVYSPKSIYCFETMILCWRELAVEHGFPDLHIIGVNLDYKIKGVDAILFHAPHMFWKLRRDREKNNVTIFEYAEVWDNIIKTPPVKGCTTYFESPVDYDDTPRKGQKNGIVMQNFDIDKFYDYLKLLYEKSLSLDNEFIFINAWNEWGEGMHLEPDEKNGYKYLETVKRAKTDAMNTYLWQDIDYEVISDSVKYDFLYKSYEKNRKIYSCLNRWMYLRENGIHLSAYLCSLGVSTVAIYGMGILGKHLLNEFEDGLIEIKYLIDKNTRLQFKDYNLVAPDGELEETDAIIVTAVSDLDFIFRKLDGKTNAKLIGIEEIIYES